jgi:integrase/recombinase XerD
LVPWGFDSPSRHHFLDSKTLNLITEGILSPSYRLSHACRVVGRREPTVANRKASIWTYKRVGGKWKYCKPLVGRNNKIKPEPGVAYYLRYRDGAKLVWQKCASAADAENARRRQEAFMVAHAEGVVGETRGSKLNAPPMVSDLLEAWLEEYRLGHQPESHALMRDTLYEFFGHYDQRGKFIRGFVGANIITQIKKVDLLRYRAWSIDTKKRSARTAANKMFRVNQFIRSVLHLDPGKGLITMKDGKYVELEPTVYSDDELKAFFDNCPDTWRVAIFKTYLMSGLRKAELEHLEWDDIDFKAGTITVSPKLDFTPKDHEQRTIEVPDELLTILKELPHRGTTVFANSKGGMYTHSWDDCKAIGDKAKIADSHPHKFRATFATRCLQSGIDLKTVQKLLGHRDIESTMRYLAKAESKKVREKVNAVKFGA